TRSALGEALIQRDPESTAQSRLQADKSHKAFQDAVNARINKILKRLKQLEAKIEKPGNSGVIDSEEFLNASLAAFKESGVKHEYLALQQELARLYDSLEESSRSVGEFQIQAVSATDPACPPAAITNTLGGTSADFPSTTGQLSDRLIQTGVQSTCAAAKAC